MIIVHKPEKKINNYISKIKVNNKNIKLRLNDNRFVNIKKINDNLIIKLYINNDNKDTLNNIDNDILNSVLNNNKLWFNNGLESDKINEYFRYSVDNNYSVMSILLDDIKLPLLFYNSKQVSSIYDLEIKDTDIINIEIEAQGLYFYKEKFGIRWILRNINVYNIEKDISIEDILVSKDEIEDEWKTTLNEFNNKIEEDCKILQNRIDSLLEIKEDILNQYNNLHTEKVSELYWNHCLNEISKKITKYYNGTLKLK